MASTCINTRFAVDKDGYGLVTIAGTKQKHHRLAYCEANDLLITDIAGKVIMHTCDNPSCVNPDHLVLGTHADNTQDMWAKGRQNVPSFKGDKNPAAKLTDDKVREIRELAKVGNPFRLAKQYGISQGSLYYILSRRTWKHVG